MRRAMVQIAILDTTCLGLTDATDQFRVIDIGSMEAIIYQSHRVFAHATVTCILLGSFGPEELAIVSQFLTGLLGFSLFYFNVRISAHSIHHSSIFIPFSSRCFLFPIPNFAAEAPPQRRSSHRSSRRLALRDSDDRVARRRLRRAAAQGEGGPWFFLCSDLSLGWGVKKNQG